MEGVEPCDAQTVTERRSLWVGKHKAAKENFGKCKKTIDILNNM